MGKNLGRHDEWARAAKVLDDALAKGLPSPRIEREALRQRVIAACVLRDAPALAQATQRIEGAGSPFADSIGRRQWLLRLAARCAAR